MRPAIRTHASLIATLIAVMGSGPATWAADAPAQSSTPQSVPAPAAHWVERKFNYVYQGFTTKYSCDGLRDTVRDLILDLGARRADLDVKESGCTNLNGPEEFPGVAARFSVLVPVTTDEVGKVGAAAALPAQWQTVDLVRKTGSGYLQAPCELLEQLKEKLLPMFTTRNLNFRSSCMPHQVSPGQIQFTVDVLRAAPAAPAPAAAGAAPTT
jgi:hypothetical protein